jgi:outer membrane protein OmpA-like peptidoglycan-associated protein
MRTTAATAIFAAVLCIACEDGARAQSSGLALSPGVTVNFSIYGGYSSSGTQLGDYDFVNRLTAVSGGGYSYSFWLTGPAANSGTQTVSAEDRKSGTTIREYWPSGDMTAKGHVSYLTISDATFADLKAGKETKLEFDDAESPRSIAPVGTEELTTLVSERPTAIHTIKVKGAAGGTFWIVDDPAFPMVIKGETKWKWMATSIAQSRSAGSQVVASLRQSGEATTHAILFAFNSAVLDREALPVLEGVAQYLKAEPLKRLLIEGHTDNIGGDAYNLDLSQKRAEAVKAYLVAAGGIDAARLDAIGKGLTQPVAGNAMPEGRAQNRRVVFRTR